MVDQQGGETGSDVAGEDVILSGELQDHHELEDRGGGGAGGGSGEVYKT